MTPTPERPETNKVRLEELLRLKRAERPSPEFWTRFEQDLRAKQLAAIIEPRPWWMTLRLPQIARTVARYQLPVGAAAVLALGFVVVREYRPLSSGDVENYAGEQGTAQVASADPVAVDTESPSSAMLVAATVEKAPVQSDAITSSAVAVDQAAPVSVEPARPVGPGELLAMIPWSAPQVAPTAGESEPGALGELSKVHFASAIKPARDHRFDGSVEAVSVTVAASMPAVETADELGVAQASPVSPREVRRNRILSNLIVADADAADRSRVAQAREAVSSALGSDQLYDGVRRLGMGGDRLTLKF